MALAGRGVMTIATPADNAWFVFDRRYCGPATVNPVSIADPTACMPWGAP
jgi:hypothetical protein